MNKLYVQIYNYHHLYQNRFLNNITEIMSATKTADKGDFTFVIPRSSKIKYVQTCSWRCVYDVNTCHYVRQEYTVCMYCVLYSVFKGNIKIFLST